MKKLALGLVSLLLAGSLTAATLVLKGGKRLDVKSFVQQGNLMVVTLPDGRAQSYPLAAIDAEATREANPAPVAPPATRPAGPQSPFAAAKAAPSAGGALVVTDADVGHAARGDEEAAAGEEKGKEKEGADAGPARVEIVSYQKTAVDDDQWELSVVVSNLGGADAGGVTITAHPTDASGNSLGSGSGSLPGKLEPGKQATVTIKLGAASAATGFRFDINYQTIKAVPPAETPTASGAQEGAPAVPAAASQTPRVSRVQAPPNTMTAPNQVRGNPNAQLPLTAPPTAPPATE